VTRPVTQPLLCSATGLPEGARYFGFVIPGRPPAFGEPASTVPGSRAVLYIADLVGESRTFGGRQWSPIVNAPAEVLELIDAANGQLVTVVRAAFLPDPPSSAAPREAADGLPPSLEASKSKSPTGELDGDGGAGLSRSRRHEPRLPIGNLHWKRPSSRGAVETRRPHRGRHRQ
jgi:hypothetical protein